MEDLIYSRHVIDAVAAFRLAKMKVSRLGLTKVDKLLVKAEALLVTEAAAAKAKLWERDNHAH